MYVNPLGRLRSDEVPIIAQTGERVLSREQNKAYERGMSSSVVNNYNFTITATDAHSFKQMLQRPGHRKALGDAVVDYVRAGK